jgi:hypothetical protein
VCSADQAADHVCYTTSHESCVLRLQGTLEEEAAAEDTGLLGRFVGGLIIHTCSTRGNQSTHTLVTAQGLWSSQSSVSARQQLLQQHGSVGELPSLGAVTSTCDDLGAQLVKGLCIHCISQHAARIAACRLHYEAKDGPH